mmetsp:Transcript_115232/g.366294  ORF Transcript_115232/g.366294 Transcript_115232/m.366294 type:complete len:232 (+) Transcript_115232:470-1165(+)
MSSAATARPCRTSFTVMATVRPPSEPRPGKCARQGPRPQTMPKPVTERPGKQADPPMLRRGNTCKPPEVHWLAPPVSNQPKAVLSEPARSKAPKASNSCCNVSLDSIVARPRAEAPRESPPRNCAPLPAFPCSGSNPSGSRVAACIKLQVATPAADVSSMIFRRSLPASTSVIETRARDCNSRHTEASRSPPAGAAASRPRGPSSAPNQCKRVSALAMQSPSLVKANACSK